MASKSTILLLALSITLHITATLCDDEKFEANSELLRGSEEIRDENEEIDDSMQYKNADSAKEDEELMKTTLEPDTTTVVEEFVENIAEKKQVKVNYSEEEQTDKRKEETTLAEDYVTEAVGDVDNGNAYKQELESRGDNHLETTESYSPTTMRTLAELEGLAPSVMGFAADPETTGVRSPKTDHTDARPEPTHHYEPKPVQPSASKSSTLRGWLEDTWLRPPAALLVPLRPMALNRALGVWNDLSMESVNVTDLLVVGYDFSGMSWRSRFNLQPSSSGDKTVSDALSKLLQKYQGVSRDSTSDGTMRALVSAAKLVPYDSALFVITDKGPGDAQRLPLALKALVEKRLKVYTIWTDPRYPSAESELELQILRNISRHTEGEVLPYSLQNMEGHSTEPQWQNMDGVSRRQGRVNTPASIMEDDSFDTLLVRRGGGEAISLGVPVENGVTALKIFIEGLVEHAVLYPPNDGPQIDLYNMSSVSAFSPNSRTDRMYPRSIYLVFPGAEPDVDMLTVLPMTSRMEPASTAGMWHLSVRCDTCEYRLRVAARAQLHFHAEKGDKDMLRLRVTGPVASVRETVLVDEYGTELAKLPFSYQPIAGNSQDRPTDGALTELTEEVALPSIKGSNIYAKVVGRDVRGEPFVRLSGPLLDQGLRLTRTPVAGLDPNDLERAEAINSRIYQRLQYNESNVLPFNRAVSQVVNQRGMLLTGVQIGLSTRLYGAPGDTLQLHYEVTNYRDQVVRFTFLAVGELRFLRGISPNAQTLAAGQSVNVVVTVVITSTAQPGARDFITFTASGLEQVSISSYVYVVNSGDLTTDVWSPEVRHNFQGSCIGQLGSDCAQHAWSATVIARDNLGGLLRLASSPVGLTYDSNFVSGTREEVVAVYRATCCAPRVVVTAVDAYGNANSYLIDISGYMTPASIAAITLGVLLIIALILLVVFMIYWCLRRRRQARELPTYNTGRRAEG